MELKGWSLYPITAFNVYSSQWDQLNNDTLSTPLLHSDFIIPLLNHFGTAKEKLAIYQSEDSIKAMAIVVQNGLGVWSTFQPSQAPIGCWIQTSDITTENLAHSLRKKLSLIPLVFSVTQQDPELLVVPKENNQLRVIPYIETAKISINESFEDYWTKRGKNLRQNLRKQRNRLEREGVTTHLVKLTTSAEIIGAIQAYGELESAGWKSEKHTAISANNTQGQFYIEMLKKFAAKDKAIVFQLWYDNRLVATDLCILGNNSIIILKTTYDEKIKISSPALLLKQDAFKYIFDNKLVNTIEFYGKVMEWHTKWSNEIRTMYHINTYSPLAALIKLIKQ